MFSAIHPPAPVSDGTKAAEALADEGTCRFESFSANDAVNVGLSLRKRFRGSLRHRDNKKGMVISVQTIAGHTLFSCTVGDFGHKSGMCDVSLDSWSCLEVMSNAVKRTGHSSYYVEKAMNAIGKIPRPVGVESDFRITGGAYPIWLENFPCCPVAIVGCYSGSSDDDHRLAAGVVRDYRRKMEKDKTVAEDGQEHEHDNRPPSSGTGMPIPAIPLARRVSTEWVTEQSASVFAARSEFTLEHHDT